MFRKTILIIMAITIISGLTGCGENKMEKRFRTFVADHVEKVEPLMKAWNLSYWNASLTGKKEDFDKTAEYELNIRTIYSDTSDFAYLNELKKTDQIKNPLLKRHLDLLYNAYLSNQIEPDLLKQIVEKSTGIENKFNVFRGKIGNREVTDNEIKEILKKEINYYESMIGDYQDSEDPEKLFVERVEYLISIEHTKWFSIIRKEKSNIKNSN